MSAHNGPRWSTMSWPQLLQAVRDNIPRAEAACRRRLDSGLVFSARPQAELAGALAFARVVREHNERAERSGQTERGRLVLDALRKTLVVLDGGDEADHDVCREAVEAALKALTPPPAPKRQKRKPR